MCSPEVQLLQQAGKRSAAGRRVHAAGTPATRGPQQQQQQVLVDHVPLKSIDVVPEPPSLLARYTCASMIAGVFAIWGKLAFVDDSAIPGATAPLHSWKVPAALTTFYLLSLPLLHVFSRRFLNSRNVDVKLLLKESMIVYNAGQVALNAWMVYRFLDAVFLRGHPFIGGSRNIIETGATYAVWIHYMDKYLEFFDTYFMVLRGRIDQVRAKTSF
jgi:elongation of very long chain fatty acids protein 4